MRDIKFRMWDGHNKSYLGENKDATYYLPRLKSADTYLFFETEDSDYVIEQYTGLKDKNGVEIYEGDIVKFCLWTDCDTNSKRKWKIGTVEYVHDRFSLRPEQVMNTIYEPKMYEVIGNIHENPELLEVTK